jgi:hypothetical protein
MAGEVKDSLEEVLERKMLVNTQRPKMHGVLG